MLVKDLIEKLKEYNEEATVYTIRELNGKNVGVEATIYYHSTDNSKENASEIYIDAQGVG